MKIDFYKKIDLFLGVPLCYLLSIFKKHTSKNKEIKKILVIKLWALGDSVVILPLINALRKNYPDATIDVLARNRNKDIFKHNKDINKTHLYEPKHYFKLLGMFKKYDLIFDAEPYLNISALLSFWLGKQSVGFSNQLRSELYDYVVAHKKDQHMMENYLGMAKILGITINYDKLIQIETSTEDKKIANDFINKIKGKMAGLCIGTAESASKTRVWQDEKWAELADKLCEQGYTVFFVGAKNEEEKIIQVKNLMKKTATNLAGKFNILQTAEIMKSFDLFISIDTGPMHLAAAQGVKTIGLFGPNTPTLWAPYGKENISIYKNLPCSPCIINDKGCMPDCLRKKDRYACMKLITVEDVTKSINRILR